MSHEEQQLVRSIADALDYPLSVVTMCWDAAARVSPDDRAQELRGRARRARTSADQPTETASPDWSWLNGVTLPTCGPDRAVPPQRLRRMLELLAQGVRHSDLTVAAAAQRTRRIIASFSDGGIAAIAALDEADASAARALATALGIAAIAALDEADASAARALATALGIADADDAPIPWRRIADRALRSLSPSIEGHATLAAALTTMGRRADALRLLQEAAGDDSDAAIVAIASCPMSPLDILAALSPQAAARALATLSDVQHAIGADVLPGEWRWSHPRWAALTRAVCRMMFDAAERGHALTLAVNPVSIPTWAAPPRESLPPPLLRAVTAQALRLNLDRWLWELYPWKLAPWLDGREAIAVLRAQGLDDAAIAERLAQVCGIDRVGKTWQTFVAQPSVRRLAALWKSRQRRYWEQCAVVLSCLPDGERDAAMTAMTKIQQDACRARWALAAVWLWRDERAEAMLNAFDGVYDALALARSSADLQASVWECNPEALRDDASLDAALLDDWGVQEALACRLVCVGCLPRWAERALRMLSDAKRNQAIGAIIFQISQTSRREMSAIVRYLRCLGWSGECESVATVEAVADDRAPSTGMAQRMLRKCAKQSAWTWFEPRTSSAALSALWTEATRLVANGETIGASWVECLPLAPPPPHLRAQAIEWMAEIAQDTDKNVRVSALRGIAIAAAHPSWELSTEERACLRETVAQIVKAAPQRWRLQARAIEALDALEGRYAVDVWSKRRDDLRNAGRESSRALARALLRRWDELPGEIRSRAFALLRQAMDQNNLCALRSALRINGWKEPS